MRGIYVKDDRVATFKRKTSGGFQNSWQAFVWSEKNDDAGVLKVVEAKLERVRVAGAASRFAASVLGSKSGPDADAARRSALRSYDEQAQRLDVLMDEADGAASAKLAAKLDAFAARVGQPPGAFRAPETQAQRRSLCLIYHPSHVEAIRAGFKRESESDSLPAPPPALALETT